MQFPNNVNKSNLIKLGVLGVGMYLMNNRNKANANNQKLQQRQEQLDTNQEKLDRQSRDTNQKMTPFTFGKSLADKLLGKK